jgi:NADH-quinone oxidoreductase subunit N
MAYGLSFVYGATGTSDLGEVAAAVGSADPLLVLGLLLAFAGFGFKIAAFPFHMWVPDTYEAASTPFVAWLSVAPKAAGFVAILRVYVEGMGDRITWLIPVAAGLAALTIVAGNLMALPQQNVKRLLAYSGIAHIGYMLIGLAAASGSGTAMVLFYLVAYVFGNMGAFLVVEAVYRAEGSENVSVFSGLAQRSPVLALSALFLLSLGGIPFVAGSGRLYVSGRRRTGSTGWCCWGRVDGGGALLPPAVAKRMSMPGRPDRGAGADLALALALCPGVVGSACVSEARVPAAPGWRAAV